MKRRPQPPQKRGRPATGKKAYCIRMLPETHDVLMQMAKWQQFKDQHLTNLLEMFATDWTDKMAYLKSNRESVSSPLGPLLFCAFDAKRGLDDLILRVQLDQAVLTGKSKSALVELKTLCVRFIELLNNVR